ncbi:MAG: class I tRNA ligase family protein, partial [Firmicutes bacterium]|nr:class I tRNA ligase family protein [Bacillota bacterium]
PFAPFLTDELYTNLIGEETVHLAAYPKADASLIDEALEERMDLVRSIVTMGRGVREKTKIKVRQPLSEILLDGKFEEKIGYMADLIKEELNVKTVRFEPEMDDYLNYQIKPDFRVAGPVLGAKIKAFGGAVNKLDPKQLLAEMSANGKIVLNLNGEDTDITSDMVSVNVNAKEGFSAAQEGDVCVILDTNLTDALIEEGLARELVSKIQQMRKSKDFDMMDRIHIYVGADEAVQAAIGAFGDWIKAETLADSIEAKDGLELFDLNGHKTGIDVERI